MKEEPLLLRDVGSGSLEFPLQTETGYGKGELTSGKEKGDYFDFIRV